MKTACPPSIRAARRKGPLLVLAALTASFPVIGCGTASDQPSKLTSFSSTESQAAQAELFTVPADQMSHLQIVTMAPAPLVRTLRLTGAVAYNAFRTTPVITQVGGPVSRIVAAPGEQVNMGQAMLYVTSPDYSLLRSAFIKARDAYQLADKQFTRAQDLYTHRAISQADLESAESVRSQAQADLDSSTDAMRVLGIADPESILGKPVSAELPLLAPVAGEVVERLCSPGQLLQAAGTQCFTISDMSSVWILANIYQNDIPYVHVGDEVTIENQDATAGEIRGKIQYVAPALDPTTRTLQARIETNNPREQLKKDMFVTVDVRAGTVPNALTVPDPAVLRDAQNNPYVYVQNPNNQFARRDVTLGESQGGKTQALTGLRSGDRVVADGSLFLQFQNSAQH